MAVEANLFRLSGLASLSESYRVYRVLGLQREDESFFQNRDQLVRHLLYRLRTPCLPFESRGGLEIVIRADAPEPEKTVLLVGCSAVLEATGEQRQVDFLSQDPRIRAIALRFINFMVNKPLYEDKDLWQPGSGGAFFEKEPRTEDGLDLFRGFLVRSISLPNGEIGMCVDGRLKFVSSHPLAARMTRQDFRAVAGSHFVYRYGPEWYDIKPNLLNDFPAKDFVFLKDGQRVKLVEDIARTCHIQLPPDCAVLKYFNKRGEDRAAPSVLLHLVHDTESERVKRIFHRALPAPETRRAEIIDFVQQRLNGLQLGRTTISVDSSPAVLPTKRLTVPDLQFGRDQVLSVARTAGTIPIDLASLGTKREDLLVAQGGLFKAEPLGRQYLVLPRSIQNTYGPAYIQDLTAALLRLHAKANYSPVVIYYDDQRRGNFAEQGAVIVQAITQPARGPGHALIMVHRDRYRAKRTEEKLAAYLVRNLQPDILTAVVHSAAAEQSYVRNAQIRLGWGLDPRNASRFKSYLNNVALSKVLITNGRWPYVLAQPPHADLLVGIDVKEHTAGFVAIAAGGREVASRCAKSRQRECLSRSHVQKLFTEVVKLCLRPEDPPPRHLVVHRDGRVFQSELDGLNDAVRALITERALGADAELTIVEVAKHSQIPVRFFENSNGRIQSPTVGTYLLADDSSGYVATTGQPFRHPGTANPLCVRVVHGPMPLVKCLSDIFALSCLAWSQPKDCSRYPITLKLADRFLAEIGAEYDENEPLHESRATTVEAAS